MKFRQIWDMIKESKITTVNVNPEDFEGETNLYTYFMKQFADDLTIFQKKKSIQYSFKMPDYPDIQKLNVVLKPSGKTSSTYQHDRGFNEIVIRPWIAIPDKKEQIVSIFSHELQHMVQWYADKRIAFAMLKKGKKC